MAIDDVSAGIPNWEASPSFSGSGSGPTYPAEVLFEVPPRHSRLWAIPVFGFVAKLIILIPHFICLAFVGWVAGYFLTSFWYRTAVTVLAGNFFDPSTAPLAIAQAFGAFIVAAMAQLLLWLWVLFGGRYPGWGYALVGGYLRWSARVSAFFFGLTDQYPPFSLKSSIQGRTTQTLVRFEMAERSNRWWAVPLLAIWVKLIFLIPHFIIISVLGLVCGVLYFILWIPVLFTGRYPAWGYHVVGGTLRWYTRVYAYLFGLTDRYPPFSLA